MSHFYSIHHIQSNITALYEARAFDAQVNDRKREQNTSKSKACPTRQLPRDNTKGDEVMANIVKRQIVEETMPCGFAGGVSSIERSLAELIPADLVASSSEIPHHHQW